ncbi:hypothetical protein TRIUR3_26670 [Triticum urartu]|uniref:Uncharacterized protein n=1 Tax=Triticum urartu TaxID=4572 RepID=M8AXA9_TRIUA|nr:hypothetical protein TRIUR3_26670 [Triticum urartu]
MTETSLQPITNSGIWIPMLAPTCSTMISSDETRCRGFNQSRIQFPLSIDPLAAETGGRTLHAPAGEEELRCRRRTNCVYCLASPLTYKKVYSHIELNCCYIRLIQTYCIFNGFHCWAKSSDGRYYTLQIHGLVVVVPMAVPFTFMQGLKFDVGWAHKFDVCSYRFLSKPAETKFSSADHTELSQLSVSQRSSGFMQGLADGNDFRGCRALHTSSRLVRLILFQDLLAFFLDERVQACGLLLKSLSMRPRVSSNAAKQAKLEDIVVERDAIHDQVKIIIHGVKEGEAAMSKIKVLDDEAMGVESCYKLAQAAYVNLALHTLKHLAPVVNGLLVHD